ncbi:MAG TPA: TlpA disulfide reductase family protein [Mariprofundaceae bacterium]|nr:TlpA disulfide reductase family protein [Mariprofundaceae bacterium]
MFRFLIPLLLFACAFAPAQATAFQWLDEAGTMHHLDEYSGKPVLLHLWASWCPPCRAEMPELSAWLKKHPEVTLLPVSVDNEFADAKNFLAGQHIVMPALLTDQSQAMSMGARGLPTTIIISANGKIKQGFIGARNWLDSDFTSKVLREFTPADK